MMTIAERRMDMDSDISKRIAIQSEKVASVADELWKTNRECGNVNSVVAGWAIESLMEVVASMVALAASVKAEDV